MKKEERPIVIQDIAGDWSFAHPPTIDNETQDKTLESLLTAEKGYNIAKSCIADSKMPARAKLIWADLENRPYLRSCQILSLEYHRRKDYQSALPFYFEGLRNSPVDNQGLRYLVLECYFGLKDYVSAEKCLCPWNRSS